MRDMNANESELLDMVEAVGNQLATVENRFSSLEMRVLDLEGYFRLLENQLGYMKSDVIELKGKSSKTGEPK